MTQWYPQDNILVNQAGRACLTDFGTSTVVGADARLDPLDLNLLDVDYGGSIVSRRARRASPELLNLNFRPTKESDVYALGMVIYEVRVCVTVTVG